MVFFLGERETAVGGWGEGGGGRGCGREVGPPGWGDFKNSQGWNFIVLPPLPEREGCKEGCTVLALATSVFK